MLSKQVHLSLSSLYIEASSLYSGGLFGEPGSSWGRNAETTSSLESSLVSNTWSSKQFMSLVFIFRWTNEACYFNFLTAQTSAHSLGMFISSILRQILTLQQLILYVQLMYMPILSPFQHSPRLCYIIFSVLLHKTIQTH